MRHSIRRPVQPRTLKRLGFVVARQRGSRIVNRLSYYDGETDGPLSNTVGPLIAAAAKCPPLESLEIV